MKKSSKIVATVLSLGIGATLLTGYSYTKLSKLESLTQSLQGHWKDQDGAEYFISDKNIVLKDTNGDIKRNSYKIDLENQVKNEIKFRIESNSQVGIKLEAIRDIKFTNKDRKSAKEIMSIKGLPVDITISPDYWTYVDNKTDVQ